MNYPMAMRGFVKLRSRSTGAVEPDFATIGGFTVKGADGRTVHFDWCEYSTFAWLDQQGRLELEFNLRDFDTHHFTESNPGLAEPDWALLLAGDITEVYYEAGYVKDGQESDSIRMKVVTFELYDWDETGEGSTTHAFTVDQLADYNRKAALA